MMDSQAMKELNEKLNTKQIGVKEYRVLLRKLLQASSNEDILGLFAVSVGHFAACKGKGIKPVRHINITGTEHIRNVCVV